MRGMWKTGITSSGLDRNERSERVEFRVLGPVEVLRDGVPVDLGVYKQRALLALLLIDVNRVVSTDRIIDELWGQDAGRDRQNALWLVVSRLRSIRPTSMRPDSNPSSARAGVPDPRLAQWETEHRSATREDTRA
jgi:hypothetical protein